MSENKTLTAILAIISIFLLGAVAFGLTQIESLNPNSKTNNQNKINSIAKLETPKNGEFEPKMEAKSELMSDEAKQKIVKEPKKEISATNETNSTEAKAKSILEIANSNPEISIFVSAVKAAGLEETLTNDGPFTIFAPDNESFTRYLSPETLAELQKPEKKDDLARLLRFHVINGVLNNENMHNEKELTTIEDGILTIRMDESGKKFVDNIEITKSDVKFDKGIIHIINRIIPE